MKKHLLIGKCRTSSNPKNIGGVIVLFEQLASDFKKTKRQYEVVDLNRRNYFFSPLVILFVCIQLLIKVPKNDTIFFNGTAEEYKYYALFLVLYGRIWRKKIILRKFAGNFDDYYKTLSSFWRCQIDYALKNADINYFETKYLLEYFKDKANNCLWFPNVRNEQAQVPRSTFNKRFVFISQVRADKGISEILEASLYLPDNYTIHVYGVNNYICPDHLKNIFDNIFKGPLPPDEVIAKLNEYDVLLLPTYHKGEGYPGIIIEALSIGIPSITTPLRGIKEMIDNDKSGLFVCPRDSLNLINKILTFSDSNFSSFSREALNAFQKFNSESVMKRIFKEIK